MPHVKGHKETKWERFKRRLRDNKKTRAEQFANYLNMDGVMYHRSERLKNSQKGCQSRTVKKNGIR